MTQRGLCFCMALVLITQLYNVTCQHNIHNCLAILFFIYSVPIKNVMIFKMI